MQDKYYGDCYDIHPIQSQYTKMAPAFQIFKVLELSSDAVDGLPGADRRGVIEATLYNNSFQNH